MRWRGGCAKRSGPARGVADAVFRSRAVVGEDGPARPACVVGRDGRIEALAPWDAALTVTDELGDSVLLPGAIDAHVHVNEPGRADREGFVHAPAAPAA